jgi:hypothetical protein
MFSLGTSASALICGFIGRDRLIFCRRHSAAFSKSWRRE